MYLFFMNVGVALSLCFLPLALCFAIVKAAGRQKASLCALAALMGLAAAVPASLVEFFALAKFPRGLGAPARLLRSVALVGLTEEIFKCLALLALPSKKIGPSQFVFESALCGTSLACFESCAYFMAQTMRAQSVGARLALFDLFSRFFTADALHAFCAGLCGVFVLSCKRRKADFSALALAVSMHGLYDFFAASENLKWLSIAAIALAAVECRAKRKAMAQ